MARPSLKHDYKGCGVPLWTEIRWAHGQSRKKLEKSNKTVPVCGAYRRGYRPYHTDKNWTRVTVWLCDRCVRRYGFEW